MSRKTSLPLVAAAFAIALAFCAGPAMAAGGISGSLGIVGPGSGDAGTGWGSPSLDDAYDAGGILRVEGFYDFTPMLRGEIGLSGARLNGRDFGGVTFDDLKMTALYGGVKVRFLEGRPFRPYAESHLGFMHYDSVSVVGLNGPNVRSRYWDSTDTGYFDVGGGCEFEMNRNLAFFADLRVVVTGAPDNADPRAEADGIVTYPLTVGVNFKF